MWLRLLLIISACVLLRGLMGRITPDDVKALGFGGPVMLR
jgi:hypothetical protein